MNRVQRVSLNIKLIVSCSLVFGIMFFNPKAAIVAGTVVGMIAYMFRKELF